ncbi:hypothetical protein [Streptomyces kanamyceticus]|uniref:Uncharacterized protein n=1 Tax=Streptomyces kanamyceticus TaxID=1967 RepID=A0A5J6GAJ6_STRKN|nr:hypothetical protein [Streptomyces kanamyceticus]QEU90286.1 hypothetical protein CP970_04645 [Streptomyces kanamyceticus]
MNHKKYASLSALSAIAATAVLLGALAGPAAATPRPVTDPPPQPAAATGTGTAAAPRPTLTAQATRSTVRASEEFRVFGTAGHLPPGTSVTLQQKQGERWVDLPATVRTTSRGTYAMRVVLDYKGRNALRMTGGGAVSPVVYVTVDDCPVQGCEPSAAR